MTRARPFPTFRLIDSAQRAPSGRDHGAGALWPITYGRRRPGAAVPPFVPPNNSVMVLSGRDTEP